MNAILQIQNAKVANIKMRNATGVLAFAPLILLPLIALLLWNQLAPWQFMWLLALAIFSGCKWLTRVKVRRGTNYTWRDGIYLFLWPGLNADEFFDPEIRVPKPQISAWWTAVAKTVLGCVLLWGVARFIYPGSKLLAGWCGMLGLIFLLHFGTFHLLALAWQSLGINAQPLMKAPILSKSLAEFWGRRWNRAFSHLAHETIFRKGHRHLGADWTLLLVFLVSGLIHELVISVPARGGYGWPTLFFVVQGLGLLLERSKFGRWFGSGNGFRGWCFMVLLTAGPAYFLFHPLFVLRVIMPLMEAVHAL